MARVTDAFFNHPRQVYPLTQVALWHIAGYAGLLGHLVLIMTATPADYGYGWTDGDAIRLYGLFVGLIQCSPLLGGWIADTFLGQRRSAVLGMWLQAVSFVALIGVGLLPAIIGWARDAPIRELILAAEIPIAHLGLDDAEAGRILAVASQAAGAGAAEALHATVIATYGTMSVVFYGSLLTFIAGFGLQSPTLAAMVGSLYEGGGQREAGYTLLFMAAMLGFIIGALVSGTIASRLGWIEGLASAGLMTFVAAVLLSRVRLPASNVEPVTDTGDGPSRLSLSPTERRRVAAICAVCITYFVFIAAFEQWGGSFSLWVENETDRVVSGFEIPTLWIHSVQALFVIIVGPVMLAVWNALDERGVCREPPGKMGVGLLLTAASFLILVAILPSGEAAPGGKTHLFWPLAFYWVVTFGQMTVVPVGQAFVSREAPKRLANTAMGVWLLFGGLGAWVSGQVGALAEPFSLRLAYMGVAVACTLTAIAALALRKRIVGLLGA